MEHGSSGLLGRIGVSKTRTMACTLVWPMAVTGLKRVERLNFNTILMTASVELSRSGIFKSSSVPALCVYGIQFFGFEGL